MKQSQKIFYIYVQLYIVQVYKGITSKQQETKQKDE